MSSTPASLLAGPDDILIGAVFKYASSKVGAPRALLPVARQTLESDAPVSELIGAFIETMDVAGRAYHKCASMPSLDPADYRLYHRAAHHLVTTYNTIPIDIMPSGRQVAYLSLLYVGGYGEVQREQARALGGIAAIRQTAEATAAARQLLGLA